jgi:hypothetical protein
MSCTFLITKRVCTAVIQLCFQVSVTMGMRLTRVYNINTQGCGVGAGVQRNFR